MCALVIDRRAISEGGVPAMRVLPTFNPFEYGHLSFRLTFEPTPVQQLTLERGKEALRHRVVVCIAHRTHRGHDARLAAALAERVACVLAAAIRMMNDLGRPPLGNRHGEG